ncbi:MAG: right-handed parallel beta-helix repeat-containing protein, partial [Dysgonamonadaceae bacterium]|nr:right-handed parallel beta-helix repeat-containing protein [Dysgonamonadaceae bacterium]
PTAQQKTFQPDTRAKLPSQTGALTAPAAAAPTGSVVTVHPGESIQDAIDKNKNTNNPVILTKGIHTIKEPLKIQSGITLAGEGKETILFLSPGSRETTIINASSDLHDVTIRDLLIEGAIKTVENEDPNHDRRTRSYMSAPSREGILFAADKANQMKNIRFENLTVQNCTKNGVAIKGASGIKIINCDFSDNGSSVVPGAGLHHNLLLLHVSDCEIRNSRFDTSPWGSGIDLSFGKNVIITGNEAARNTLSGIRCTESENVHITGNLIEGNNRDGISLDTLLDGSKGIETDNNLLQLNGQPR